MIGIWDYDFFATRARIGIPNLEAMKLSRWLAEEKNENCVLISSAAETENKSKIYFFSNKPLNELPPELLTLDNTEYYGTAFQGQQYVPFEPIDIEYTYPSTRIYKDFLRQQLQDKEAVERAILNFLETTYYRAYVGQRHIPVPPAQSNKKLLVYDEDIFAHHNWKQVVEEMCARRPSSIRFIHPLRCKSIEDFLYLRKIQKVARINEYLLNFSIPTAQQALFIQQNKRELLAAVEEKSNIYFVMGENYTSKIYDTQFYVRSLIQSLNFLYSCWAAQIPMKLYFYPTPISVDNKYELLLQAIASWSSGEAKVKLADLLIKGKKKKLFEEFLQNFPKTTQLFQMTKPYLYNRGFWSCD